MDDATKNIEGGCEGLPDDKLADLLDSTLPHDEARTATEHLATCAACRARKEEIAFLLDTVRDEAVLGDIPVPEEADRKVKRLISKVARDMSPAAARPRLLLWAGAAAACLLAMAGGFLLGRQDAPDPIPYSKTPAYIDAAKENRRLSAELVDLRVEHDELVAELRARILRETQAATKAGELLGESEKRFTQLEKATAVLQDRADAQEREAKSIKARARAEERNAERLVESLMASREERETMLRDRKEDRRRLKALIAEVARERASTAHLRNRIAEIEAAASVHKGDVNLDGRVDVVDALALCRAIVRGGEIAADADLNGDGKVDVGDALLMAGQSLGENR
jgi:hypothetical protein